MNLTFARTIASAYAGTFASTGIALGLLCTLAQPALAHQQVYNAVLTGLAENPSNASAGLGSAVVTFDLDLMTMRLQTTFAGLTGLVTASHIHCCALIPGVSNAGVASQTPSFAGFPLGGSSGAYDHTFDLALASSYNAAYVTANGGTLDSALAALLAGAEAGQAYLNIHSSFRAGGEIRGFLVPVPEPSSYALLLSGIALLGWAARRQKRG